MPRPKIVLMLMDCPPPHYFSRKKNGWGCINLSFVVEERRRKLSFQGKGNGKVWEKIYI